MASVNAARGGGAGPCRADRRHVPTVGCRRDPLDKFTRRSPSSGGTWIRAVAERIELSTIMPGPISAKCSSNSEAAVRWRPGRWPVAQPDGGVVPVSSVLAVGPARAAGGIEMLYAIPADRSASEAVARRCPGLQPVAQP
jgi:hypothetical protein